MPLAFVLIGTLLVITAYQNTFGQFSQQLLKDFSGQGSFFYWIAAVLIIGFIGYIKAFEKPSRLFIGLLILVFFLANKGVFAQLTNTLQNIQSSGTTNATQEPQFSGALPIELSGSAASAAGGIGGLLGGLGKLFGGGSAASSAGGVAGSIGAGLI